MRKQFQCRELKFYEFHILLLPLPKFELYGKTNPIK